MSPLIAIVGQTASGKSDLALQLAQKFSGELICADARTVYKGMDIGTAKPSAEHRAIVPHHLLDIVEPHTRFSAAQFKRLAIEAIEDISDRGRLPILVGGTGLYVDAVLFDYSFSASGTAADPRNPRHRARQSAGTRSELRPNTLVLGLDISKEELRTRVKNRVEKMIAQGLEKEVRRLIDIYGWEAPGLNTIGYKEWRLFKSEIGSVDEVVAEIINSTMAYAKRQKTWFQRNKSIHWVSDPSQAVAIATTFLNKTA